VLPEIQTCSSPDWQSQLRDVITSADELLALLDLTPENIACSHEASKDFPLKVPHAFARRMCPGDPRDPLLLQVIASPQELDTTPGYSTDPLAEQGQANPRRGIIHKYHGRALLLATGACAVHCRYCFRRHFPYAENRNSRFEWRDTLSYIAADPDISELILSGGDPLVLTDEHLKELVTEIATIPSVKRLRIHSRLPIVIPDRITLELLRLFGETHLEVILVIHANHGNEIDGAVKDAMQALKSAGVTLLNQSVLLRNINDNTDALVALSEKLFDAGVLPYYLHLLDPVQGAAHFDVPEDYAKELLREASARLSGYLVPRLVREVPEALSKTFIA
jgi:EF-P beta-lysylation protein EpmB